MDPRCHAGQQGYIFRAQTKGKKTGKPIRCTQAAHQARHASHQLLVVLLKGALCGGAQPSLVHLRLEQLPGLRRGGTGGERQGSCKLSAGVPVRGWRRATAAAGGRWVGGQQQGRAWAWRRCAAIAISLRVQSKGAHNDLWRCGCLHGGHGVTTLRCDRLLRVSAALGLLEV